MHRRKLNPPGNESEAVDFLVEILEAEGIRYKRLTNPNGRTSLWAGLEAENPSGPGLLLIHHIDVVPAGEGWRVEPFSGRLRDGEIWGRGAIDVKSLGIAHLAVLVDLKRRGVTLERDVAMLAVADEEVGGREGMGWLVDAHPELLDVGGALNEGGLNRVLFDRVLWWGVEIAQKRPLWLRLRVRGRGGHASNLAPESPTHRLIHSLARLIDRPTRFRVDPVVRRTLGAQAMLEGGRARQSFEQLDEIIASDAPVPRLPMGWPAFLTDTIQVTRLDTSDSINVIAAEAVAYVDIRLLPETDDEAFLEEVRERLGPAVQVEVLLRAPRSAPSPTDHELYRLLEEVLGVRAPVIPTMVSGVTDARWLRERGVPVYGIAPFSLSGEESQGIHARNESISQDELLRGIEMMRRIVGRWTGVE
ncbi:MAG: M20/M25/M40 family metallo-hydrolase [Acidobacteriota bacterium]